MGPFQKMVLALAMCSWKNSMVCGPISTPIRSGGIDMACVTVTAESALISRTATWSAGRRHSTFL